VKLKYTDTLDFSLINCIASELQSFCTKNIKTVNKVIIATQNPVKIKAVQQAFGRAYPNEKFIFEGKKADSNVHDQPFTNLETLEGAQNRARNAKTQFPEAVFWIGIEGGVEEINKELFAFAWMTILSSDQEGKAKSGSFCLPSKISKLLKEGKELGDADDIVFGKSNSKQKNGAVGLLTKDVITRTSLYTEALILALIPFNNPNLY